MCSRTQRNETLDHERRDGMLRWVGKLFRRMMITQATAAVSSHPESRPRSNDQPPSPYHPTSQSEAKQEHCSRSNSCGRCSWYPSIYSSKSVFAISSHPAAEMLAYSGLCPTSTNAAVGPRSPLNVASSVGKAATTSGHQGFWVVGSLEAKKAMKKAAEFAGISSWEMVRGGVKVLRIGILVDCLGVLF